MNEEGKRLFKAIGGFCLVLAILVSGFTWLENWDPGNLNDPFEIVKLDDGNLVLQKNPKPNQYFEYEGTEYVFWVTDVTYMIEKTCKYPYSTELNKYEGIKVIPVMETREEAQKALNAVMNEKV